MTRWQLSGYDGIHYPDKGSDDMFNSNIYIDVPTLPNRKCCTTEKESQAGARGKSLRLLASVLSESPTTP